MMRNGRVVLTLALMLGGAACTHIKEAGRTVGHTTRDVTREIGHTTRDVTREIGHGTRDTVNKVGDEITK